MAAEGALSSGQSGLAPSSKYHDSHHDELISLNRQMQRASGILAASGMGPDLFMAVKARTI